MNLRIAKLLFSTIWLLVLCFFTACQLKKVPGSSTENPTEKPLIDIGDGGYLSGDPCGPPCFWNIKPDITTKQQALDILQARVNLRDCSINNLGLSGLNGSIVYCEPVNIAFDQSGYVSSLSFNLMKPISVGDALAKFGNQDEVYIETTEWDKNGNTLSVWAKLFFDNIRTEVVLLSQDGQVYNIIQSTEIKTIGYSGREEWGTLRQLVGSQWHGYGQYNNDSSSTYP